MTELTPPPRSLSRGNEFAGTGVPSLDAVIGGGYPVGSVILINEDERDVYSQMFMGAFLAQGVVNGDHLFIASQNRDTESIIQNLPQPDLVPDDDRISSPSGSMEIAWRYETSFKPRMNVEKHRSLSNNFYFKKSKTDIDKTKITEWPGKDSATFLDLKNSIIAVIKKNNLLQNQRKDNSSIGRIVVQNLGSFFWDDDQKEIPKLIYELRSVAHLSRAIIFITMPHHLIENDFNLTRTEQSCDIVMTLNSLDTDANPLFKDYNGLIKFIKVNPIRSLAPPLTEGQDWAFKLIKKKLLIERLTLPPELSSSTQREQDAFSCSTSNKSLEF